MASLLSLLAFPALVLARIDVELFGEFGDQPHVKVFYSGSEVDVISDTEINTFELSNDTLKNGVNSYFGKRPDDVYLRSPTPFGDLYKNFDWSEVTRTLVPIKGTVLEVTLKPIMITQQFFVNNSSKPTHINVAIHQEVSNTVSTNWNKIDLSVNEEINYEYGFEVYKGSGNYTVTYTSPFGENITKSKKCMIGAPSKLEILVLPSQAVTVQLLATKTTVKVEMEYEATLSGTVVANYNNEYWDRRFWGLDIGKIMTSAGLTNEKMSKEVIEIVFYSQWGIVINDRDGAKMYEVVY